MSSQCFSHFLQKYDMHLLFQVRYVDPRLVFREISPNRIQPIVGRTLLRQSLWSPHIFMANARASNILGTTEKDVCEYFAYLKLYPVEERGPVWCHVFFN